MTRRCSLGPETEIGNGFLDMMVTYSKVRRSEIAEYSIRNVSLLALGKVLYPDWPFGP